MFQHDFLPSVSLARDDSGPTRVYLNEENESFVSVTAALSHLSRKGISEWKKRVGEDEAKRVGMKAARFGTSVHDSLEKYCYNDPQWKDVMPTTLSSVNMIREYLDKNVTTIYGLEHQMFSRELKTAGTVDCVCDYNSKFSVVDFKTSKRVKTADQILSYFLQCTAYGIMIEELYDRKVEQIVVLMAVTDTRGIEFVYPFDTFHNKTKNYFRYSHDGLLT